MNQPVLEKPLNTKNLGVKFFVIRIMLGGFFLAIGIDKVLHPYQNFLYVVQGYQIFPEILEEMVARIFPWIELFLGLFLVLGLYLKWTLRAFLLIVGAFILIIVQALFRRLPIEFCGCFGGLFSSKIQHTLVMDLSLWVLLWILLRGLEFSSWGSLDKYFMKAEK